MKPAKRFDCVRMKWEIQERLMKEYGHLPNEVAREAQRKRIEQDPEFSKFLERVDPAPTDRVSIEPTKRPTP